MSVVAGCLLFDGAMLAADCRITFQHRSGHNIRVDYAQKVFAVAPGTAIGFVGDVKAGSVILQELLRQVRFRRRQHPISLHLWMPRLFRSIYSRLYGDSPPNVAFMVASSMYDQVNYVERETVAELARHIGFGKSVIQRNWMPRVLIDILSTPASFEWVGIPGTHRGLLYTMRSPIFEPELIRPLHFAAIGSGEGVSSSIAELHDMIVASQPGNPHMETMWFRTAIEQFMRDNNVPTVGGLYPIIRVKGREVEMRGMSAEIPVGGTRIELTIKDRRWIQRNVSTGKEIQLLYPWEIPNSEMNERLFNDLEEAYKRFRSPEAGYT